MWTFAEAAEVFDVPLQVIVRAVRSGRLSAYLIDGVPRVRSDDVAALTMLDLRRL